MAIAREELVIGGKCFFKSRPSGNIGGMANAWKLQEVTVRDVIRAAAKIEFDNGSTMLAPFGMLQAHEGWLTEHERREAKKKERIRRERELSELMCGQPLNQASLTHTLGDKLKLAERDDDDDAPVASEQERVEALKMLDALKTGKEAWRATPGNYDQTETLADADAIGQNTATAYPREEREVDAMAQKKSEQTSLFDFPGMKPENAYAEGPAPDVATEAAPEPAAEPAALPEPVQPAQPAVAKTALQLMLEKIQAELETLIAEESELEPQVAEAERILAELRPRLEANRTRQRVLATKERAVLGVKVPAPAPQRGQEGAPEPMPQVPPLPAKRGRGRPPGSKSKPRTPLSAESAPVGTPRGPGWLRRRLPWGHQAAE